RRPLSPSSPTRRSSDLTLAGIALGLVGEPTYSKLAVFMLIMGLGIAFTDVLTDAMMVENGKPLGLTGAFQSVQWTAINVAILLRSEEHTSELQSRFDLV